MLGFPTTGMELVSWEVENCEGTGRMASLSFGECRVMPSLRIFCTLTKTLFGIALVGCYAADLYRCGIARCCGNVCYWLLEGDEVVLLGKEGEVDVVDGAYVQRPILASKAARKWGGKWCNATVILREKNLHGHGCCMVRVRLWGGGKSSHY
jgi:hypothetical protein